MQFRKSKAHKLNRLSAALFSAILLPISGVALAQEAGETEETRSSGQATTLDKVTVTGSLIPQSQIETFTPVIVITAEDLQVRGFTSVADALQQSSFATGGVQGSQSSASFTQGAETMSLFGLPPGYTKYLIDGRPMANYPALYNGSDTFNNISGIPVDLVERIEILPGGQSSLYGSDAIAGVINIILKKQIDGSVINVRGGFYGDGGGNSARASFATGFSSADDRFNLLFGVQAEDRSPIWGFQRDITSQFYGNSALPNSPPVASRDYLVYGFVDMAEAIDVVGFPAAWFEYKFADPNNCANVTGQFNGTTDYVFRPGAGFGGYCGSLHTPGYRTVRNGKEAYQVYTHATFDINDGHQLYGDFLYSSEDISYHVGSNYTWWGTGVKWGYYYDPDFDALLNLQRAFSPEDMGPGGFANTMSTDKSRGYAITLGGKGTFGDSNWDYDVGFTRTEYKLTESSFVRWADPINDYFENVVLGPQSGWDPYYGAYPVFQPDYAAFYSMMPSQDFNSFTGYAASESKTWDNMLRALIVNGSLFSLRGGDAGLAIAAEGGTQGWKYDPYPGFMNGEVWGQTAVAGDGDRSRYALTSELRLPFFDQFTASLSARYDAFRVDGNTVDKPTYSLGLEYRPLDTLLLRGKYGTAFRAPTLSDQFQGLSGYYSFVTDYYLCSQLGFDPGNIQNCPAAHSNRQFFGEQEGNPDLQPINADVWSVGAVWAPFDRFSLSLDYHSWDIYDEVNTQDPNALALTEMRCRTGEAGYDINSPTCQAAISQITRGSTGRINSIYTSKVNVSEQNLRALTASLNYAWTWGNVGNFMLRSSYTNNIEHTQQLYPGDPIVDLLRSPGWSSDPKWKGNASLTWRKDKAAATVYVNTMGRTPNSRARALNSFNDAALDLADKLPTHTLWNLSFNYNPLDNLALSFMVNNVLDEMPPEDRTYAGTSGAPYNSAQYGIWGRGFYLEMRYAFGGGN